MVKTNLVLIGMPGAGKSTVGVVAAKMCGMRFVDSDLVIQEKDGRLLQQILDQEGIDAFLRLEEETLSSLDVENSVIATGGSAIYGPRAMEKLAAKGLVVYLRLSCAELEARVKNRQTRGIAASKDRTLADIYAERVPLYEKYADATVDCDGKEIDRVIAEVVRCKRSLL